MLKNPITRLGVYVLIFAVLLAACGSESAPEEPNQLVQSPPTQPTTQPGPADEEEASQPPEDDGAADSAFVPLPAAPQAITITTSDGRALEGLYYPAKVDDAPVLVLMHQNGSSVAQWAAVAPWLQNRTDELGLTDGGQPYLDSSWFPPMPEAISYAVVVFNFGNHGNSEYGGDRASYVEDAAAALRSAVSLNGVNPNLAAAFGTSIGADGAVDGCFSFNDEGEGGTCLGALSLSPGNYLTREYTYAEAVELINASSHPVWCLAAVSDGPSAETCRSASGGLYRVFLYGGAAHGINLIDPDQTPSDPELANNTLEIIQEWLEEVYGVALNDFDM